MHCKFLRRCAYLALQERSLADQRQTQVAASTQGHKALAYVQHKKGKLAAVRETGRLSAMPAQEASQACSCSPALVGDGLDVAAAIIGNQDALATNLDNLPAGRSEDGQRATANADQ